MDAENDSLSKNIAGEKMNTWTGNIGLVNVSDVLKASTNPACTSASAQYLQMMMEGIFSCNNNYLFDPLVSEMAYWSINNTYSASLPLPTSNVWAVASISSTVAGIASTIAVETTMAYARPVLYLRSNIQFTSGNGSKTNPYLLS